MNHIIKIITPLLIVSLFVLPSHSQKVRSERSHEIAAAFGMSNYTTDYGARYNTDSNITKNYGIGFGIIHYLTFTNYRYRWNHQISYWAQHFKIRSELSYHSAPLEHYGKWIKIIKGVNGEKLRAMHGKARTWNLGSAIEYHFVDINDFASRRNPNLKWSPYISLGAMVNFYNPTISTRYGDGDWKADYSLLFPKWAGPDRARDSRGITMSATLGVGTRYKLSEYSDFFIESRHQYFFSNWVDGLNARDDVANKFVDWLIWLHVG